MRNLLLTCLTAAALGSPAASAAINIPSDGSDGELVITTNTEIDLSQAPTGNWDANNSANAGRGIYELGKSAIRRARAAAGVATAVSANLSTGLVGGETAMLLACSEAPHVAKIRIPTR